MDNQSSLYQNFVLPIKQIDEQLDEINKDVRHMENHKDVDFVDRVVAKNIWNWRVFRSGYNEGFGKKTISLNDLSPIGTKYIKNYSIDLPMGFSSKPFRVVGSVTGDTGLYDLMITSNAGDGKLGFSIISESDETNKEVTVDFHMFGEFDDIVQKFYDIFDNRWIYSGSEKLRITKETHPYFIIEGGISDYETCVWFCKYENLQGVTTNAQETDVIKIYLSGFKYSNFTFDSFNSVYNTIKKASDDGVNFGIYYYGKMSSSYWPNVNYAKISNPDSERSRVTNSTKYQNKSSGYFYQYIVDEYGSMVADHEDRRKQNYCYKSLYEYYEIDENLYPYFFFTQYYSGSVLRKILGFAEIATNAQTNYVRFENILLREIDTDNYTDAYLDTSYSVPSFCTKIKENIPKETSQSSKSYYSVPAYVMLGENYGYSGTSMSNAPNYITTHFDEVLPGQAVGLYKVNDNGIIPSTYDGWPFA